jgi:hypothetical protein
VLPTLLTVLTAALLGGAIAAEITAVIVLAAVALGLIGLGNGVINLAHFCDDQRRDDR